MTTRANISPAVPTAWQQLKERALSIEAIRAVDQTAIDRYGMNSLVLMENAALGSAQWIIQNFAPSQTVLLCGRGNNGGDGLAIARHLRLAGWPCRVIQLGPIEKLSADARANWHILTARDRAHCILCDESRAIELQNEISQHIRQAEIIIDALLGSGAKGHPRPPLSDWIELANQAKGVRIAIDIPSGLDATSGQPSATTFQAQATLTFVARKLGFATPAAQAYLGKVEVLPIGIPVELIEEILEPLMQVSSADLLSEREPS